ncbi:hypothetical protein COW36_11975 [bacterium (Candidatus Blackallbacteria) CG17_big_fil_post_rev_8_21_14_2_50_48_46]|uniref:BIG2 domain-containing protein n=1 Tax=bacterium (Candidatus Blackallbacteria) CG17_big_fil_post_rev_8_21_14_2_50_48_46 TaxID=2014261 RepID=A0A2M7G3Y5_9BACT|nr:MAG: hypothetical protein COW64_03285 [bacterium (Candidatus Blackallbacteria) CG18_big_fil_WC_8_21_14_2_50_49_26]PIW16481.1 MAG: hypothetical protein COW36_11975 [bacterium (Candidatus Blackallbacteria) CG17_big_fil_post_rev_8_21_14_2_50_48_46]PIW45989.1 MAG: hypothetical protein COW20_17240 [bacterium (Candidatus Blackallbacteria) CG13_big_fil_rev_8_21_14_2_50_49_14]
MKRIQGIQRILTGLIASSLLTACGGYSNPITSAQYVPVQQAPAPTVTRSAVLPRVILDNKQPTLPEGKSATDIRFDMAFEAPKDTTIPLATPSASPSPAATGTAAATAAPKPTKPAANEMGVPIGTTKKFSVEITLDDGQLLSNFTNLNWTSTNRDVGTISSAGIFTPVREGTTQVIASIGGVAATMVVKVTPGNFIWQQMASPTQANLYGVKLVNDAEAWAVGAGGTVLHFLQGTWYNLTQQLTPMTNGANIYSIDMISNYEGWAVGDNLILHYISGRWERVPVPVNGTFKSIDMLAPGIGWIAGESGGSAVVLRLAGPMGWQPVASGIEKPLNTISVVGPNNVWVGGDSGNLERPTIYRFNGTTWVKDRFTNNLIDWKRPTGRYSIRGIKMANSSVGWAVGEYDPVLSSLTGKRGAIFKYDAINDIWAEVPMADGIDKRFEQVTFNAVGMLSPTDGWVLGATITAALDLSANNQINGNLMRTDGSTLAPSHDYNVKALPQAFNGIDVVQNGNGIIVGDNGLIMHHQYDLNYRNNQGNFGNFSGDFGYGYAQPQTGGSLYPQTNMPYPQTGTTY